jgi:predicted transcriptional regulator
VARFDGGWVKLYRRLHTDSIAASDLRLGLFCRLIMWANLQPSTACWKGEPRALSKGEVITSLKELAEAGGSDPRTIRKHLNFLQKRGSIECEISKNGTLIRINNFNDYQEVNAVAPAPHAVRGPDSMQNGMLLGVLHNEEYKNIRRKEDNYKLEKIEIVKEGLDDCVKAWGETLRRFGITRDPKSNEMQIARLISQHGYKDTYLALVGAAFEDKTETFDPSKNCSIARLSDPKRFEKFANLGSKYIDQISRQQNKAPTKSILERIKEKEFEEVI